MSIDAQTILGACKKYPILIISAVISVGLLATLYFRSDLLDAQQAELDTYLAESSRHRLNILSAAGLQDQFNFLVEANQAVKSRSLMVEGLAQNLQYFYRLESEVGIKYLELRPGSKPPAGKSLIYVPLNYIVSVQGDFPQIVSFLRHLEQGSYFCRINSALTTSNGDAITLKLNLDLLAVP